MESIGAHRFDLGYRLSDANIKRMNVALGIDKLDEFVTVGFDSFYKWWMDGPAVQHEKHRSKLDKLDREVRRTTIPWIKQLYVQHCFLGW